MVVWTPSLLRKDRPSESTHHGQLTFLNDSEGGLMSRDYENKARHHHLDIILSSGTNKNQWMEIMHGNDGKSSTEVRAGVV